MKLAIQDRTKFGLAALLLAGAIALAVHSFSGGGPAIAASRSAPAPTQPAQPRNAARRVSGRGNAQPVNNSLDPRLNLRLLASSESIEYAGNGRNIFLADAEPVIPKPVAPAITPGKGSAAAAAAQPSGPPPPPPIPLKFFGFASKAGEPTRVFLSQGDEVFVAAEGQTVDRRYKVVKINPTSVEIQDMISNNSQTIPLTQS